MHGDTIAAADFVIDETGCLAAPYGGRTANDPGAYALAWKPQCLAAPVPDLCLVLADFLKSAAARCPEHCLFNEFGLWLGVTAATYGRLVGYSPLIVGQAGETWRGGFYAVTTQATRTAFLRRLPPPPPALGGIAATECRISPADRAFRAPRCG